MTPARLREIGEALYGPEWISPMGRDLGVGQRTIQRWASGQTLPKGDIAADLRKLVRTRGPGARKDLAARLAALDRLLA